VPFCFSYGRIIIFNGFNLSRTKKYSGNEQKELKASETEREREREERERGSFRFTGGEFYSEKSLFLQKVSTARWLLREPSWRRKSTIAGSFA
jgi:hypothetical protein